MDKPIKASKLEDWDYRDETHSANERLRGDGEWSGPVPHRRCTNLACLILFVLANGALGTAIYFVVQDSDVHRLFHGADFRAEVCGYGGLTDMPYAYYPDSTDLSLIICQQRCPQYFVRDYICYYDTDYSTLLMDFGCWDSMESTRLGFYCIPGDYTDRANVWNHLMQPLEVLKRAAGDYMQAWDVVLVGIGVASSVGLLLLTALRWRWTAIWLLSLVVLGGVGMVLFFAYLVYLTSIYAYDQDCGDDGPVVSYYCDSMQRDVLRYISLAAAILAGGMVFVYILRWRALKVGVQVVRAAGTPLHTMKQIIACPFISLALGLAVLGGLAAVFAFTMSAGTIEITSNSEAPQGEIKSIVFKSEERYYVIYNLLMTLWWVAFLSAMGEAIMSTAVSCWYFSRGHTAVNSPLLRAFKLCFLYHLGTVCVGSFLHTVLWIPASILNAISTPIRSSLNKRSSCANCVAVSCCCLETHERFLKFLHKRAYIYVIST